MITTEKRVEFNRLTKQFGHKLLPTADGLRLLAAYDAARKIGTENFAALQAKMGRDEGTLADCTNEILLKLLPHADSAANRWRQAWIHPTAAIPTNIKRWYEAAGHTNPDEWPATARAIWHFVQRCIADPKQLPAAAEEFGAQPIAKGFQTGMLSPILNALRPDDFALVHNRVRNVLNYFGNVTHAQALSAYSAINADLQELLVELIDELATLPSNGASPADLFDLFCTWLTNEQNFSFREPRYWLLQIGADPWQWAEWQEGNFAALGWDELGDLSELRRRDFDQRRDSLIAQYASQSATRKASRNKEWTKTATNIVWRFARQLHEGDCILAYRGDDVEGTLVLGIGTITGPYFYVPGAPTSHRYPVLWQDVAPRHIAGELIGKQRISVLQQIDRAHFDGIVQAYPIKQDFAPDSSSTKRENEQPDFLQLFAPIVDALQSNGGTAPAQTITEQVLADPRLTLHQQQGLGQGLGQRQRQSQAKHRIYRARTVLSRAGLLDLRHRGMWSLTKEGLKAKVDGNEAVRLYQEAEYKRRLDQTLQSESPQIKHLAESSPHYGATSTPAETTPAISRSIEDLSDAKPQRQVSYSLAECAEDTYLDEPTLARWAATVERKGQAIFYGPPGTGKTYIAQQLARHLVGGADGFCELVQFHPAYTYEDFVQGIRPQSGPGGRLSYPVVPGRFLEFCRRAECVEGPCVLIIDEINRANLANVFGELMYLLEYRAQQVKLAGGECSFQIPKNVRLIGTMNTADRSIALVDHALRRRFAFIALYPNYDVLRRFHTTHATSVPIDALVGLLKRLNRKIDDKQYAIGVSFFMREQLQTELVDIWQMEIEPYLEEYFFDQPDVVEEFRWAWVESSLGL